MAIIRLDCNLNGGDSVTPNNELFYRIYGDIDAYALPIHTTGTDLSDANVTVNNDNVIITGVDGTTNTSFKIAAVDGAGNEGILSDALSTIVIISDDFAGTTLDSQWTKSNLNPTELSMSQNNLYKIEQLLDTTTGLGEDSILNTTGGVITDTFAMSGDIQLTKGGAYYMGCLFGLAKSDVQNGDITNSIVLADANSDLVGKVKCLMFNNGASLHNSELDIDWSTSAATIKFYVSGGDVTVSVWGGSSWTDLLTVTYGNTGTYYPFLLGTSGQGATNGDYATIDNFYLTNANFTTRYPV